MTLDMYQHTLIGTLKFEATSLIGRVFKKSEPPGKNKSVRLLNFGCGYNYYNGWINADFFKVRMKVWKKRTEIKSADWQLDFRYPFNCPDNYWDGVFTEHVLEHLYPNEVYSCLSELYRTMKTGSWIRIIVPDLKKYIEFYNGEVENNHFNQWQFKAEAIRSLTQNYFHHSTWDGQLMMAYLSQIGFKNIKKVDFQEGTDKRLLMDTKERAWESLYVEGQKN